MTLTHPSLVLLTKYALAPPCAVKKNLELVDWENLRQYAEVHRLFNLLYESLLTNSLLPANVEPVWRQQFLQSKYQNLLQVTELCAIHQLLLQNGIEAIFLKGRVQSQLYFDDYLLRQSNDIDLLLRLADLEKAYLLLKERGYEFSETLWNTAKQKQAYHKHYYHYCLYHPQHHVQVEIHWRLFSHEQGEDQESLWLNSRTVNIGNYALRCLSAQDNFLYLCEHGSTHHWARLFWLADIAQIIKKEGQDFLINTYQVAQTRHKARLFLYSCQMAAIVFGSQLPNVIQQAIQQDGHINVLVKQALIFIETHHLSANPIKSHQDFKSFLNKTVAVYRSAYYLQGNEGLVKQLQLNFVNPKYWSMFAFNDRVFGLNFLLVPFLWVASVLKKYTS